MTVSQNIPVPAIPITMTTIGDSRVAEGIPKSTQLYNCIIIVIIMIIKGFMDGSKHLTSLRLPQTSHANKLRNMFRFELIFAEISDNAQR